MENEDIRYSKKNVDKVASNEYNVDKNNQEVYDGKEETRNLGNRGDGGWNKEEYSKKQPPYSGRNFSVDDRNSDSGWLYRNSSKRPSLSQDSEGIPLEQRIIDQLVDSAIINSNGNPSALYHATNVEFDSFEKGDIGFHFGTKAQASKRAKDNDFDSPRYVRAYLNIKKPVYSPRDTMSWHSNAVALNLWSLDILTDAEKDAVIALFVPVKDEYNSPAAKLLRKILEDKGYDGIAYPNSIEGEGISFIAFYDSQIIRSNDGTLRSRKIPDPYTSRELLAKALTKVAKGDEKVLLDQYKSNLRMIEGEMGNLKNLRKEIDAIKYKKSITYKGENLSVKEFEQRAYTQAEAMRIYVERSVSSLFI